MILTRYIPIWALPSFENARKMFIHSTYSVKAFTEARGWLNYTKLDLGMLYQGPLYHQIPSLYMFLHLCHTSEHCRVIRCMYWECAQLRLWKGNLRSAWTVALHSMRNCEFCTGPTRPLLRELSIFWVVLCTNLKVSAQYTPFSRALYTTTQKSGRRIHFRVL